MFIYLVICYQTFDYRQFGDYHSSKWMLESVEFKKDLKIKHPYFGSVNDYSRLKSNKFADVTPLWSHVEQNPKSKDERDRIYRVWNIVRARNPKEAVKKALKDCKLYYNS